MNDEVPATDVALAVDPFLSVWIGERPVVGSGVIVLGRNEPSLLIMLDNLHVQIAFVADPGALSADVQMLDETTMRIRFTGTVSPFGASYELPNIAFVDGRWLHFTAVLHAIAESAVVRQVAYTFTASEYPL